MRKLLCGILAVGLTAAYVFSANTVLAEEDEYSSRSVYLHDVGSGTVLASKNENERLTIASMCKIMTLLIVFEEIKEGELSFDDMVTVSETASGMGGSQAFLEAGAEYKVSDLIKSVVIASANDSCVALAEKTYGTETAFVKKMNDRAKELDMQNTLFSNCTGLPRPTQYSCARDVAVMFSRLLSHEEYFKYSTIRLDEIKHPEGRVTGLTNTNKLLNNYSGCDGGKTGYTAESGHCLASTAKRGSMRLVSVVICSPDSKTRFNETKKMLDYGFNNFRSRLIVDSSTPIDTYVKIRGGSEECAQVKPETDYYHFGKINGDEKIRIEFVPYDQIKAPVDVGQRVGQLNVFVNEDHMATVNCVSVTAIDKKGYFEYVRDVSDNWVI